MKRVVSLMTLAAAFTFTACEAPTALDDSVAVALRPAFAVTANNRLPFTFFIPPCNGEAIDGSGIVHMKMSTTVATSGQVTVAFLIHGKSKGTGLTTGASYEWNDVIQEVLHFDGNDDFPATGTFRQRSHLSRTGASAESRRQPGLSVHRERERHADAV